MKNKNFLLGIFMTLSLLGCGGSDAKLNDSVTKDIVCDSEPIVFGKNTIDVKYARDGDIGISCENSSYKLENSVEALIITQITDKIAYVINGAFYANNGEKLYSVKGSGSTDVNYEDGTVHEVSSITYSGIKPNTLPISISISNGTDKVDCTKTYPSILPSAIVNNHYSISTVLSWQGDKDNMISNTCYGSDDNKKSITGKYIELMNNNMEFIGNFEVIQRKSIIDSNNKTHKVAIEMKLRITTK